MQKEKIERANEIMVLIKENEQAIEDLEEFSQMGGRLYKEKGIYTLNRRYEPIRFESWEIRLIIHNKKQRIAALEKELEEL